MFTVFALSQRILKLGLKIRTFLNSAFPGQFRNVLTCIPRLPESQDNAENINFGVLDHPLVTKTIYTRAHETF